MAASAVGETGADQWLCHPPFPAGRGGIALSARSGTWHLRELHTYVYTDTPHTDTHGHKHTHKHRHTETERYIHTDKLTHRHRQTDIQIDTDKPTHTDRQIGMYTHKHTNSYTQT